MINYDSMSELEMIERDESLDILLTDNSVWSNIFGDRTLEVGTYVSFHKVPEFLWLSLMQIGYCPAQRIHHVNSFGSYRNYQGYNIYLFGSNLVPESWYE